MTDPSRPTPSTRLVETPRIPERKPWQTGTAPRYISLFLWVVFFDQLGRRTLAIGGLMPSVLGALAGGLICYLLLYYAPAMWGFRTGRPLTTLGGSTFGESGSFWLNNVLMGMAQVVWLAVATHYATELTLQGLVSFRLIDPKELQPILLGGLRLPSVLFLVTSLFWSYAAALVGLYLVSVIGALMNIFPIFIAMMLGAAMLWTIGGVSQFRPLEIDPATSEPICAGGLSAFMQMVELICGFFATAGALSVDGGSVNQVERDVRLGGLVGVVFAPWIVATLSLLTVAGALGNLADPPGFLNGHGMGTDPFSFRTAATLALPATLGGTLFLVLGLGSLAPTCYASHTFGRRFAAAWPRFKRIHWTLMGTTVAWLFLASGRAGHLETIFAVMGAVFAPVTAAITADYLYHRGAWSGARRGVNLPGLVAWSVGLAVGLVPVVAEFVRWLPGTRFQPAVVFAYIAALATYLVLAALGTEAPLAVAPEPAVGVEPAVGFETSSATGSESRP